MKKYKIPYTYCKSPDWSAIDLHNDNNEEHLVTVNFYSHPTGNLIGSKQFLLEPKSSFIVDKSNYPYSEDGRYIVEILGPEYLYVTHVYKGSFQMIQVFQ